MRLLILFNLLIFSQSTFGQATDLKEYGLNGKVKKVTAYNLTYNERKEVFDMDKANCDMKTILFFNTNGNIDSTHTYGKIDKNEYEFSRRIFQYINGVKTSYKSYTASKKVKELGTYKWLDNKTYTINFESGLFNGSIKTTLNKNYRELSSEVKISGANGDIYINDSYQNNLNDKGHIEHANFLDMIENNFYKCNFNYLKFDKNNNPIELKQDFPTRPELNKYIIRTIEYYN